MVVGVVLRLLASRLRKEGRAAGNKTCYFRRKTRFFVLQECILLTKVWSLIDLVENLQEISMKYFVFFVEYSYSWIIHRFFMVYGEI